MSKECLDCTLSRCNGSSPSCLVTNPRQLPIMRLKYDKRFKRNKPKPDKPKVQSIPEDRTEYFANYYQRHREAKKAAALARYYAKRAV